eukprot:6183634-Prymnesium_polylepis.1
MGPSSSDGMWRCERHVAVRRHGLVARAYASAPCDKKRDIGPQRRWRRACVRRRSAASTAGRACVAVVQCGMWRCGDDAVRWRGVAARRRGATACGVAA